MKLLCYALPVLLLVALAACSRHEDFPWESTYRFVNQTGTDITLDLYGSKADYAQNTSRIARYRLVAGTTFPVVLQTGRKYWMDWYNDSYSISSWRGMAGSGVAGWDLQLNVAEGGSTRYLKAILPDTVRSVMLGGGGTSSEWKGTDMNGVVHRFVFRKDFTGTHEFGYPTGTTTTENLVYAEQDIAHVPGGGTLQFTMQTISNQQSSPHIICNLSSYAPITGRDSLLITSVSGSGYFVRRQ